jgi:RHS repeat-associated protein
MQNRCVLIVGFRGSGKSTVASSILRVNDGVIVFDPHGDDAYRFISNTARSLEELDDFSRWWREAKPETRAMIRYVPDGRLDPFDALNNLLQVTATKCISGQPIWSVNTHNQVTNTGFSYDSAGDATADGVYTYTYDAEYRIITASGMTGGPYCYTYDGNGLRVMKANANGGSCTGSPTVDVLYWRNIAGQTIAETDGRGSTTNSAYREYVFFGGRRIAQSNPSSGNVYYYFVDHLGSTRTVTTALGSPCYEADFLPYGYENTPSGFTNTCSTNYKFTGYERDAETAYLASQGNDYAFARYYSSRIGRFMTGDPLSGDISDPQTLNRYAYVRNNPVNLIDPSGMGATPYIGCLLFLPSPTEGGSGSDIFCTGGGGGCASTVGSCSGRNPPVPPKLPPGKPQKPGLQSRIACAASYGQNHSIAAAFGAQNSFVGNLFGGNTFSGLANLGLSVFGSRSITGGDIAGTILGGGGQGLPGGGAGFKGVAGQASDAIVGGAISTGYNAITGVGQGTLELGISASGNVASIAASLAQTTVGAVVSDLNVAKAALDFGTFAYGAIFACHQ